MRIRFLSVFIGLLVASSLALFTLWKHQGPNTITLIGTMLSFEKSSVNSNSLKEQAPNRPAVVLFGGDLMFDRWIRTVSYQRGGDFILSPLRDTLQGADLVVANLEGPITSQPSVSETSVEGSYDNYVFTFPSETADLLKRENIELVNIGNNHILNFNEQGAQDTKSLLERAGVGYFGSPVDGDTRYVVRDIAGVKIAFVNYNEFVLDGQQKALTDIALVKESADFVVVYAHWGKEYVGVVPTVRDLAHVFIDAGADLIIGSHPHVVQEKEEYKGKIIYYSLGNFVFDQYFRPETQAGLLVRVKFDRANGGVSTEDIPIRLHRSGQTSIAER